MVVTTEIPPAPALSPFVRCFAYREFDTQGTDIIKPWCATPEVHMPFFFKARPVKLTNVESGEVIRGHYSGIVGLSSHFMGEMVFNGCYSFFSVHFKPNGLNRIFKIPANKITNQIVCGDDLFGPASKNLFERLGNYTNTHEMVNVANAFLLSYLRKQKQVECKDGITYISNSILKNPAFVNIEKFAWDANMSIRNFERRFSEQVGLPPKLYCRINRFNYALNCKINYPDRDWGAIALRSGYFDQTHLIRDFKEFAGTTPLIFFKQTPLPKEDYLNKVKG